MKVLLICLTRRGGLLHFSDCLVNSLGAVCNPALITAASASHDLLEEGVRTFPLDTGQGMKGTLIKLFAPATRRRLSEIIDEFQPELIHITSAQEWNPFIGRYLRGNFPKLPLVYTVHDVIQHEGTPRYFRMTESAFRKQVKYLVVLTEEGKQYLCEQGAAPENILVVPHGVYDFFTQYAQGLAEEKEILFFGRIEPYKGLDVLLDAVGTVFEKHPDWRLHIAGGGDITPYQEKLQSSNIRVTNRFLTDAEVAEAMERCAVVALPYLCATQSGVIPTAYAFGKAVIASRVGGIPAILRDGETGLLVEPGNAPALTDALNRLIENRELCHTLGKNGKRYAAQNLSWNAIAEQHAAFYETILSKERVTHAE